MRLNYTILTATLLVAAALVPGTAARAADTTPHGVTVTYTAGDRSDTALAPNLWLYVPQGGTPSPFLAPGAFTAVFEGAISVDLRGDYAFQAELNGKVTLEINGEPALEATGTGGLSELGKMVRLSKGTNLFKATFSPPAEGDAFLRLNWQPKGSFTHPIPPAQLTFTETDALKTGRQLRLGRELVAEHHCVACHSGPTEGMAELKAEAPSLKDIGARRQFDWLAKWIADPKAMRPSAHMPKLLHGATSAEDSAAIAAYLVSLSADKAAAPAAPAEDAIAAGEKIFNTMHCVACHVTGDEPGSLDKIPLKHVGSKFSDASLIAFLKKPSEHYPWIKMPEFDLKDEQRAQLAAYLLSVSAKPEPKAAPAADDILARGKTLVKSTGCLSCHAMDEPNDFTAPAFAALPTGFDTGCASAAPSGKAPFFGFNETQIAALKAFAGTDRASLTRHVPAEFAERQIKSLHCTQCHGVYDTFPTLTWFGEKLKPDFLSKMVSGELDWKPRPWIENQMPGFPAHGALLAEGMAHQHGVSHREPAAKPMDEALAKIGHQLVGPVGGFSCTACHSVGSYHAHAFEAPGIDLAKGNERLREDYFRRWLRNPAIIDPQTKMPVYFDEEGRSPYADILDGDAFKQIDAMWHYMKPGTNMPAPKLE